MQIKTSSKSGKFIGSQCREVVYNVYRYFFEARENKLRDGDEDAYQTSPLKQTATASGVSYTTARRVKKEMEDGGACASSARPRSGRPKSINLDDFEVCALRRVIHDMYIAGERVTIDTM